MELRLKERQELLHHQLRTGQIPTYLPPHHLCCQSVCACVADSLANDLHLRPAVSAPLSPSLSLHCLSRACLRARSRSHSYCAHGLALTCQACSCSAYCLYQDPKQFKKVQDGRVIICAAIGACMIIVSCYATSCRLAPALVSPTMSGTRSSFPRDSTM